MNKWLWIGLALVSFWSMAQKPVVREHPVTSLYELLGDKIKLTQSRAPSTSEGTVLNVSPPGTIRTVTYRDADPFPGNFCLDVPPFPGVVGFSETFTTGPATSYIEVHWTGQTTIDSGPTPLDGVAFTCTVTQGGVTVPCPETDIFPFLTRRDNDSTGQQQFGAYSGIILVDPSTATTVEFIFSTFLGTGLACYQSLTLKY